MSKGKVRHLNLRTTLLVTVIGCAHNFWAQVGNGAIVVRSSVALWALGAPGKAQGEFANQICFVDGATASDEQFSMLPSEELFGIALMIDGGCEKLVASDGNRAVPR